MPNWVDADACPQVIKDILFRAAERAQAPTTPVSNMPPPPTPAHTPPRCVAHPRRARPDGPLPLEHPPKTDGAGRPRSESDRVVRIARRVRLGTFAATPRERKFRHRPAAES